MDNNTKQSAKRRSKFAGKEDVSRATTDTILSGQIDQLREISRTNADTTSEVKKAVDILYEKRIPVDTKKFEQLKREFTYEMEREVKKVKRPSRGLKWYIAMWAITLISAFLAGYFIHEYREWKESADYWFSMYEKIKESKEYRIVGNFIYGSDYFCSFVENKPDILVNYMLEGVQEDNNHTEETYSVVSYFCGCGGLDLGFRGGFIYHNEDYERLPFDIKAAYDHEPRCIETYNGYFGEGHAFVKDLSDVDVNTVPKADVLIGGFPCQEFSSCGPLGGLESERGRLYQTLISYMNKHHPHIVVGENVINLERMENGEVLKTITTDLSNAGYKVEVWKMYAPDYGVPQRRTRLFIVCVRNDIYQQYGFPKMPVSKFEKKDYRSVEWAIGDLVNTTDDSVPNQSQYFGASRAKKGNGQGDESNKKDLPAYTIRANPKSRVQFHYSLDRRLTVRECARIQTFPDDFKFSHAKTASVSQIGNAVPPTLAHIVARTVVDYLNICKK